MPANDSPETDATWDQAPCGLLRIDANGLITAANTRLIDWIGHSSTALLRRMSWNDLLAVGSRLFYETQLAPVLELEGVLNEVMLDLRRADGTRIPALVNAVRVADEAGRTAGARIALMSVPDRRAYETELREAREQALRSAAADAQARQRLELLAHANVALAGGSDVELALSRFAEVLVAELADWCLIYTTDPAEPEQPLRWASAHADPAAQPVLDRLAELLPLHARPTSVLSRVLAGGNSTLLSQLTDQQQLECTDSDEVRELCPIVGLGSALVVPSTARGAQIATIVVVRREGRPAFSPDDLADLVDLGARTGIVIDNLRRQHREHNNSVALQHALLTVPLQTPRLQIATRYLPATEGNEIGGDWYDAFVQPDGTPVVVIGDVVGHDILAAGAMGQLRGIIRTIGYTHGGTPAEILTRADGTARALAVTMLATSFVARVETSGVDAIVRWSNAGHPPPVLIPRDGRIRLLDAPPDRPLGIRQTQARHDHTVSIQIGDTVLLYTDGLVEHPDEDIDVGLARLVESLADKHAWTLEDVCDWVLAGSRNARRDDIALLALRYTGETSN